MANAKTLILMLYKALERAYGQKVTSRSIFNYIYSILYSSTYRNKYEEFLESDFPRIPFTSNLQVFCKIQELGQELVDLHLMKDDSLKKSKTKFQGQGEHTVKKPFYDNKTKRIYINESRYFEGIERQVWEYQIGGYQVLSKWLKYRMRRDLSLSDVKHFCRIAEIIGETIKIQSRIDDLYGEVEQDLIPSEENNPNSIIEKFTKEPKNT
jgi:predicted helicase